MLIFSQTGLYTVTPKATLDVSKNEKVSSERGVIIPRLTGEELAENDAFYGSDQEGTLIFVTEGVSKEKSSHKTAEVTKKGMYVYHHEPHRQWKPTIRGKSQMTDNKVFVIINSAGTRLMTSDTEAIRWSSSFDGANSHLITLQNNATDIVLPPFKTLKIHGSIPIGFGSGSESQKKIASSLRSDLILINQQPGVELYSSSPGFARSSNYTATNQGGATPAVMILYTGITGATLRVNATREGNKRTNIAGGAAHNTIGTYLIIEEI